MDPVGEIIHNASTLGFTGIRHMRDLGAMKQATLEKKLRKNGRKLQPNSIASIYMAWMAEYITSESPFWNPRDERPARRMCEYLQNSGCRGIDALKIWNEMLLVARLGSGLVKPQSERVRNRGYLVEKVIVLVLLPEFDLRDTTLEPMQAVLALHHSLLFDESMGVTDKQHLLLGLDGKAENKIVPTESSGSMAPPQNDVCHHCFEPGHLTMDCPFLSKAKIQERTPPGYVCKHCYSIRHYDSDCPRIKAEYLQKSQDTTVIREEQSENAYWAESAYAEQRSALQRQDSPELQYGDPYPETSKDRSIIWKESTPSDGRLTPWSEDDLSQDGTFNTMGRQETRGDEIPILEADSLLAEMEKEFGDSTLCASKRKDSSFSEDGSPPRKRQKQQSLMDEMSGVCDEAPPHWEGSGEDHVLDDPCGSQPSIEFHRTPKSLHRDPPYHHGVITLFDHRENVWINQVRRQSAADMWSASTERENGQEETDGESL